MSLRTLDLDIHVADTVLYVYKEKGSIRLDDLNSK